MAEAVSLSSVIAVEWIQFTPARTGFFEQFVDLVYKIFRIFTKNFIIWKSYDQKGIVQLQQL